MIATAKRVSRLGVGVLIGLSSSVWTPGTSFARSHESVQLTETVVLLHG